MEARKHYILINFSYQIYPIYIYIFETLIVEMRFSQTFTFSENINKLFYFELNLFYKLINSEYSNTK